MTESYEHTTGDFYKLGFIVGEPLHNKLSLVWGLKDNDRDDCWFSDADCDGTNAFDDAMNLNKVSV